MNAEPAIARRAFHSLRFSALVWGAIFGSVVASSALTYVRTFPTAAERQQLAATTGQDAGVSILLGPISSIDTVAGYTVYKGYVTLTTIGAIWALLAATRLLRGEEDTGRWQLLVAGTTRPARATLATLAGIGAAIAVLFACVAVATVLTGLDGAVGFSVRGSIWYANSIAVPPAVFAVVGALTSQLADSRRAATALGMAVFGVCFVLRMVADSGHATTWLLWWTPFGWTERMRPLTENYRGPFVVALTVIALLVLATVVLGARRDVGAGAFADREVAVLRPFGLTSTTAFALRMQRPMLLGWFGGLAATGLCFGIVAKLAAGSVPSSVTDLLDKFDVRGSFLRQFLGIAFLLMAAIVALLPAGSLGAAAEEETSGRLVNLLARPVRRRALFVGQLAIAAVSVVVAGVIAGVFTWLGARLRGIDTGFGRALGAGANLVPTALLVLGVGAVVRAVAPRRAAAAVYAVVAWSFVVDLLGSLVDGLGWMQRSSLFHYMALAPAEPVRPAAVVVMLALAGALFATATVLFTRRDVSTG